MPTQEVFWVLSSHLMFVCLHFYNLLITATKLDIKHKKTSCILYFSYICQNKSTKL